MKNKNMTAVEWLESIEMERDLNLGDWRKAKEMEKEQRIEDMKKMQIIDDVDFDGNVTFIFNNIEQYYKETYEH
jgi:hypothetical protein